MAIANSDAPVSAFPGGVNPAAFYSTGASGNPTVNAAPGATAPLLMSGVQVSIPGASSQLPVPRVAVSVADTATAAGGPVPPLDPLTGTPAAFLTSTGAGAGTPHSHNPNAETRP